MHTSWLLYMLCACVSRECSSCTIHKHMPQQLPRELRLRCRLQVLTMPMGNQMPVFNPQIAASPDGSHMVAENVVDAHTIPGIGMESVIQQVSSAMQVAMSKKEMAIRGQIATKVLVLTTLLHPKGGTSTNCSLTMAHAGASHHGLQNLPL